MVEVRGVGAKVTQAGRPHTAPSRHLITFAGKPTCSRFGDSDPPSSGEKHVREGWFFPPPEVPGGAGPGGEGGFQPVACWKAIFPQCRTQVTCRQDAAHPHLPFHFPGAIRGCMDRLAGTSTRAESPNSC